MRQLLLFFYVCLVLIELSHWLSPKNVLFYPIKVYVSSVFYLKWQYLLTNVSYACKRTISSLRCLFSWYIDWVASYLTTNLAGSGFLLGCRFGFSYQTFVLCNLKFCLSSNSWLINVVSLKYMSLYWFSDLYLGIIFVMVHYIFIFTL